MPCKRICPRYKATRPPLPDTRYGIGQKRCNSCDMFIQWDGNRCPCCSGMLRTKPRGAVDRQQLMVAQKVKRI